MFGLQQIEGFGGMMAPNWHYSKVICSIPPSFGWVGTGEEAEK
jgi:hypothetical protein